MHPFTDILVLVHNNLPVTRQFIHHVFENTDKSLFRLVFLDNGSTDKVSKFLTDGHKKKEWVTIRSEHNLGVVGGRNELIKHVTAEYFLNIDNDQFPLRNWLSALHEIMAKNNDIVGCEAWQMHAPGTNGSVVYNDQVFDRSYFPKHRCTRQHEEYSYIGCGGMLIKRSAQEKIGLFDEQFNPAYFEDPDFCYRAIQAGLNIAWQPMCHIKHLAHQTINHQNSFDRNEQFLRSWHRFRQKWYPFFPGNRRNREN